MPHAIERDRLLRDDGLVTVFVEVQGADTAAMQQFLWQHWPGFDGLASTSARTPTPDFKGIPHAVLIGVDGTLVLDGSPIGDEQKFEEMVTAELKKFAKGWGSTPEQKKIRAALYGKLALAEAQKSIAMLADPAVQSQLRAEFDRFLAHRLVGVTTLQKDGRWADAKRLADALHRGAAGSPDLLVKTTELQSTFATPAGKQELAVDDRLGKTIKQLHEDKLKGNLGKALQAAQKVGPETSVGKRIGRLLALPSTPAKGD